MSTILITGGTGLVGKHLTKMLIAKGYKVSVLSRTDNNTLPDITTYKWELSKYYINPEAITKADYIVHLAGAGVADESWSEERKQEIMNSRMFSTRLLAQKLKEYKNDVKAVISASGIGYYGSDTGTKLMTEESPAGQDFIAKVSMAWEKETDSIQQRLVKLRIGVVLAKEGGAFPKMYAPIKYGVGAALGTGNQFVSWIHVEDLCRMIVFAIENKTMKGVYNAVAPLPVSNNEMNKIMAEVAGRPFFMPNVPSFMLKMVYGELADLVLGGNKVSAKKIINTGFDFKYDTLKDAVRDLIKS